MTRLSTSPGPYHDRGQIDRHQAAAHVAKLERTERTIDDVIHDEYLRDPYNAAFSSISILYGAIRILRMLSASPASEEKQDSAIVIVRQTAPARARCPVRRTFAPYRAIPNSEINTVTSWLILLSFPQATASSNR